MDTQEGNTIPDQIQERWLPVPDFPGYEVSDLGRVRSFIAGGRTVSLRKVAREFGVSTTSIQGALKRTPATRNGNVKLTEEQILDIRQRFADGPQKLMAREPHILRPVKSSGYPRVALCKDGKIFETRIHILVLTTFVGPCPSGLQACHWDGDPTNNFLTNLRWGTYGDNYEDRRRHDRINAPCGEAHFRAKLTEADVIRIRELYAQGAHTHKMIADQFGVATTAIIGIVKGEYWKHLPSPVMDYAKIAESHKSTPPTFLGSKHPNAKLTDEKVLTIRQLHSQGQPLAALGRMFDVTKQVIFSIVHRKTWRHLKAEKPNQMP